MSDDWALPDDVRAATASRLALNMTALAFSRGATLDEATAAAAAVGAERKAYTTARVEARTTTGVRPGPETAAAYTRKLAELALEVVTAGPATAAGAPSAPSTSDHDLDLHGDREFLVSETAEEHFRDMLAEGAAHRKVRERRGREREKKKADRRGAAFLQPRSVHIYTPLPVCLSRPRALIHRSASPPSPSAPTPPPSPAGP
jgi:hypothetical protein